MLAYVRTYACKLDTHPRPLKYTCYKLARIIAEVTLLERSVLWRCALILEQFKNDCMLRSHKELNYSFARTFFESFYSFLNNAPTFSNFPKDIRHTSKWNNSIYLWGFRFWHNCEALKSHKKFCFVITCI